MPIPTFLQFLKTLRDEAGAKLAGSFARGDYDIDHFSDIDLVIKESKMKKAIKIFERFGVVGDSVLIGQWSSPRDKTTLPRPVEVMSDFWIKADPKLPPTVTVFGIEFKTYRR